MGRDTPWKAQVVGKKSNSVKIFQVASLVS
jgi:hypothetical protein